MRKLVGILLLVASFNYSIAQEIVIRSFVKTDTVVLRWAPTNFDGLIKGLKEGYTLSIQKGEVKKSISILPFLDRIEEEKPMLSKKNAELAELIKEFVKLEDHKDQQLDLLYAIWMLSAGPDKQIAKLLGVYYDIVESTTTPYEVSVSIGELTSSNLRTDPSRLDKNPQMTKLKGSSRAKLEEVYLAWDAVSLEPDYSAYWVERSMDSLNFSQLNEVPLLFFKSQDEAEKKHLDFVDTLVQEGETYYYRIRGINHFGDLGKTSNVVKVYIPRSLVGDCRIDTVYADGINRRIEGRFLFHTDSDIGNLSHFSLYRSDSMFIDYEQIDSRVADRNSFSFDYESSLLTGDYNYFMVAAISQDYDTTWSYAYYFFTLDQEPPSTPIGLNGTINDSGVVSLNWLNNPEGDIRGYRVFRSNSLKEEFVEITTDFVLDSIYSDTLSLRNLTSEVYYRIAAVDQNYNNSPFCEPVLILKPDTIPPVPSIFKSYALDTTGITLEWINSSSKDLENSMLIRLDPAKKTDTVLFWDSDSVTTLHDDEMNSQGQYAYWIQCQDESENKRLSEPVYVQYELGYRILDNKLIATADREQQEIKLEWEVDPREIYSISIYRKKNDGRSKLIKTIMDSSLQGFADKNLPINNTYSYRIKVMYKTGNSSKLSEPIEVQY